MDESHKSKTSDASAIRKRRSSILKNQRAPRTPLSELEFNVATPTDIGRSRRVSFSRRTGIAEFITNEATTTWKNVYEQHNKSLESSGNDSEMNAPRPHVGHIGKRIFDDQFEEVEVVEFIQSLNNPDGLNVNTSIHFTQSLPPFELTGDNVKVSAPISNFELSTFTDQQSKTFDDELRVQSLCEISAGINVNFSAVQTIRAEDDLDEIQRDLDRANSGDRHRSFVANENISGYIEFDLNTTRISSEDIDMSVTDTVPSPKAQDVTKSCYIDNKFNLNKDWMADKENVAIDPYAAPRETDNFAINQESDKVLVFDGKRLTLQSANDISQNYRQTLLPNAPAEQVPKRKAIVLNTNDDLPNFLDDLQVSKIEVSKCQQQTKKLMQSDYDMANMSTTRAVLSNLIIPGDSDICKAEKTVVFGDNTCNISMTQALPANIVYNEKSKKRRTILYDADSADISVTKAVSSNIILLDKADAIVPKSSNITVFDTDNCDISMTQALPANIIFDKVLEKRTILYENDTADISMTRALSGNIIQEAVGEKISGNENNAPNTSIIQKNARVVYDSNLKNISNMQQTLDLVPCHNELLSQHRKTILYKKDDEINTGPQALPINKILSKEKVNDKSNCDEVAASNVTNTKNMYELENTNISNRIIAPVYEKDLENIAASQDLNNIKQKERRKTIVYENDEADISITCAIPTNIVLAGNSEVVSKKRQTIVFDDNCDISMTEALPCNLLLESNEFKNKINTFEQPDDTSKQIIENVDIVNKQPAHEKIYEDDKRETIVFENDVDMSITKPVVQIPTTEIVTRNTSAFQNDFNLSSIIKSFPSKSLSLHTEPINKEKVSCEEKSVTRSKQDVIVYQAETSHLHSTSKFQSKKTDERDPKNERTNNNESNNRHEITTSALDLVKNYTNEVKPLHISNNKSENQEIMSNNKEIFEKECLDLPFACEVAVESNPSIIDKENENVIQGNKSILDDLLDMSTTSIEDGLDDKNVMINIRPENLLIDSKENYGKMKESNESMFYIIKDNDEEAQTDKHELVSSEIEIKTGKVLEKPAQLKEKSPLKLEYVEENPRIVTNIQKKLDEIKGILENKESFPKNRHYKKVLSSDIDSEMENTEESPKRSINVTNIRKSIRNADDTNDLLQLLSDFTDNKESDYIEEDDENPEPVMVNGHIALENKSEINGAKTTSFIPKRRSVISKEDLLNNMLQVQAISQKPRSDLDCTENSETKLPDTKLPIRKSVRMCNEVVKTLTFEEDMENETSINSDKMYPLKKTAFGESSYMKESKAKVIPSYMKDVSDEIKELMHDLVKPTADTMPFETSGLDKNLKNIPSTCSTQIQANLFTSSQIDVHTELCSNPGSTYDIDKQVLANKMAMTGSRLTTHESKSSMKPFPMTASEKLVEAESIKESHIKQSIYQKIVKQDQTAPDRVLVFDHHNPLNNVLLAPLNNYQVHKYNPIVSNETLCGSQHSNSVQISINEKENAFNVERVSVHYNIEHQVALTCLAQPSKDICFDTTGDTQSIPSTSSKGMSVDQSTGTKMTEVKNVDVNTVIVMKDNKELLEASSALTLVDDPQTRRHFDVDIGSKSTIVHEIQKANSPVKIIYQTETRQEKLDSDVVLINDERKQKKCVKRNHSPTRRDKQRQSNLDITPKPVSKIQKLSNSPNVTRTLLDTHSLDQAKLPVQKDKKSIIQEIDAPIGIDNTSSREVKDRSLRRSKANKTSTVIIDAPIEIDSSDEDIKIDNTPPSPEDKDRSKVDRTLKTITVQQFITDCYMGDNRQLDEVIEALNGPKTNMSSEESKTESLSDVGEIKSCISSFTSSKNLKEDRNMALESQQTSESSVRSKCCLNWGPELVNEPSSKNLITECGSSANVIAQIDALPFMGSRECEWETSECDVWSFLLLHARVRLTIRFGQWRGNTTRTYVRPDTPVNAITLDIARYDKANTVASVCVGFGAEAMRYLCVRCAGPVGAESADAHASDVPALVRRCGAVARVALRWGRAMHDAYLRLAYTLTDDGLLTLKVANVPLRSVWEVSMRVELVVGDAREAPWPRASDLRVLSLLEECHLPEGEVRRVVAHVPHDWGHVPRTLWCIFKYLKNKTRNETLLCV